MEPLEGEHEGAECFDGGAQPGPGPGAAVNYVCAVAVEACSVPVAPYALVV